jgi:hypothetical protein
MCVVVAKSRYQLSFDGLFPFVRFIELFSNQIVVAAAVFVGAAFDTGALLGG